jgi:hypothetical protein
MVRYVRLSCEKWLPRLEAIAKEVYERTYKSTEYPVIPMTVTAYSSCDALQDHVSMLVLDWVQTEYRNWKIDLPHVGEHVLSLAQHQGIVKPQKHEAKTSRKENADMVMTDVATSKSMQETISDEVGKAIVAALQQKGGSAPEQSELLDTCYSYSNCKWKRPAKTEESYGAEGRV